MSEYQYYEFRTIDRTLNRNEMEELRAFSTRAEITPTSFTNTYHWGNFKGSPDVMMERYFDAFVYVANWGTNRLMFRLHRPLVDIQTFRAYCDGEVVSLKATKEHVILQFLSNEEPNDYWIEGEAWMPSLISIRTDLILGDLRALYIGWLASLTRYEGFDNPDELDDDEENLREPPVPPGLGDLSAGLQALAEFLRFDSELIEAAAAGNVEEPTVAPSREELAHWIKKLSATEKEDYLIRLLADGGDLLLRPELLRRFREARLARGKRPGSSVVRRTIRQLLAAHDALVREKRRKAAERQAREQARREKEQAEVRVRYLNDLSRREPEVWREVEDLITTKRAKDYDRAVALLVDLRDLATRSSRAEEVETWIRELRRLHSNKPSFLKRLDTKGLGA